MSLKGVPPPQNIPELYAALRLDIGELRDGMNGRFEAADRRFDRLEAEIKDVKTGLGQLAIVSSQTLKYLSERIPA